MQTSKTSPQQVGAVNKMETESWKSITTSPPNLKFEHSPAESFLSTPGDMYPPLFGSSPAAPATVTPLEIMTPQTFAADLQADTPSLTGLSPIPEAEATPPPTSAATAEKKQVKKRKSWGQVLPEPKTHLPPRKRAKTEDEKEQRRVERVLRNRRAAQSSRERKRQEVEALEIRNKELEAMVRQYQETNFRLIEELQKIRRDAGVSTPLRPTGVTFSQELFSSQDGHSPASELGSIEDLLSTVSGETTVNPASISPALTPVAEKDDDDDDDDDNDEEPATDATNAAYAAAMKKTTTSPDATQHPAAMLCQDLQCRSAEEVSHAWLAEAQRPLLRAPALFQFLLSALATTLSLCLRPSMQIAMSSKAGFSLPPTPSILNTMIWVVTTPDTSPRRRSSPTTSTSTSSSTTIPPRMNSSPCPPRSSSLRLSFLKRILTCSPNLARPLLDATMAAMRLASSKGPNVSPVLDGAGATAAVNDDGLGRGVDRLPPVEVLISLAWWLKIWEQRTLARSRKSATSAQSKLGRRRVALGGVNVTRQRR